MAPRKKKIKQSQINKLIVVFGIALLFATSVSYSYKFGFNQGLEQTRNVVIRNVSDIEVPDNLEEKVDFSIFWETWDLIQEKHPDGGDLDPQTFVYGAITGMVQSLGDVNTIFFKPEDSQKFTEDVRGRFSGVGMEIAIREEKLVVVAPLAGSPAEEAGIKAGDSITKIDGEETADLSIEEAVKKIRGPKGSTVILSVLRKGLSNSIDISVVRDDIEVEAMEIKELEDNISLVSVHSFNANIPFLFKTSLLKEAFSDTKGIILDLRNNPGGFLDIAVDIADWFLEKDALIVVERFNSGDRVEFISKRDGALKDKPVVILVNGGSASASEILAGALRVNRGIQLVGEKTFGKGTVQELEKLSDGSSLKVTIANWLLPDDSLIEGNGLIPNIVVSEGPSVDENGEIIDPQLDRAIEILKEEIAK